MRVSLEHYQPNGHALPAAQVFAISGLCQQPRFRLQPALAAGQMPELDFALLYLGAAEADLNPAALTGEPIAADGDDPYFLLRRGLEGGAVIVTARLEWQGGFIVLANDDEAAENLYQLLLADGQPEEVRREWTADFTTLALYRDLLRAS